MIEYSDPKLSRIESSLPRSRSVVVISYGYIGRSYRHDSTASASGLVGRRATSPPVLDLDYLIQSTRNGVLVKRRSAVLSSPLRARPSCAEFVPSCRVRAVPGTKSGGRHELSAGGHELGRGARARRRAAALRATPATAPRSTVPPGRNPPAPTSCVRAEVVPCPARSREDGTKSEGCGGPHGAARAGGPRGVSAADDLDRLAGDLELLVRGDDEDAHPAARRRDVARLTGASLVGGVVELDPEHVQTGERAGADLGRVLADAGGEHDRVDAAEGGRVGADVLAQPVAVDLER